MSLRFVAQTQSQRIVFGQDHLKVLGEDDRCSRPVVVSTPGHRDAAERIAALYESAVVVATARMHTPLSVTEAALAALGDADSLIAIGGGSAIGLSKALALRSGLPQTVIPTTYAGSEMTAVLGETRDGRKTTLRDERVRPGRVIYDPALTLTLPGPVSAASGINGMAHALEALYAPDRNPLASLAAERAIALFRQSLPVIVGDLGGLPARERALEAAYLAGFALGQTTMGLHHKLAHVLGGAFDLPHAQTHAVLLPYVAAFNASGLNGILGPDPGAVLRELAGDLSVPLSLRDLGLREEDIDRVVEDVLASPYANPRPVTETDLRDLVRTAWSGGA